jgi:uncharacterized membrane protein
MDASDVRRLLGADLLEGLPGWIAASEQGHGGEIRVCIEGSLPLEALWRIGKRASLEQVVRQRALEMFGQLGVWDTERNTGLLVYVLLAEHAIEIVADRGLGAVACEQWQTVADELSQAFRAGQASAGLRLALARCHCLMAEAGLAPDARNELPDPPHLQ